MQTPKEFEWSLYQLMDPQMNAWKNVERVHDLIRARDAEVAEAARAEVLAGFTEWFAPAVTYDSGNTVPTGTETVLREFAQADALADHPDACVARRLVGPWEPVEP